MEALHTIYLLLLSVCTLSIWIFRRHYRKIYLPWLLLLLLTLVVEYAKLGATLATINMMHHLYQAIEIVLMVAIYTKGINSKWLSAHVWHIGAFGFLGALSLSFFVEGIWSTNILSFWLSSLFIIAGSIFYFYELLTSQTVPQSLIRTPFFWIALAHLLYYAGSYFYEFLYVYVKHDKIHYISIALNFILYGMYIVGSTCRIQIIRS